MGYFLKKGLYSALLHDIVRIDIKPNRNQEYDMRRFRHPFTLVELLCVVIVIALLAALSVKVTQIAYIIRRRFQGMTGLD